MYRAMFLVIHQTIVDDKADWKNIFIERQKLIGFQNLGIKKAKRLFKSSHDSNLNKGFEFLYKHEYDHALSAFARSALEKEDARAYEGITRIYFVKKQFPNVIVYSELCLKLKPINPGELLYMRGKALQGMGRLREALADLNGSIHYLAISHVKYMNLRTSEVLYDKMVLNITLGNYDDALKDCKKIESIKSKTSEYSEELQECTFIKCATLLYDKKIFQQADRFLQLSPDKSRPYLLLSMKIQAAIGNFVDALEFFTKYEERAKLEPHHVIQDFSHDTFLDIGITMFMNGEMKNASDYFVKSFKSLERKNIKEEFILKAQDLTV